MEDLSPSQWRCIIERYFQYTVVAESITSVTASDSRYCIHELVSEAEKAKGSSLVRITVVIEHLRTTY